MTTEPMTPMTMAINSLSALRRRKGKKCYEGTHSLSGSDVDCSKSRIDCSENCCTKDKMQQKLKWSCQREGSNFLKCQLSKLMLLRGDNNNKPNQQKRTQKRMQMRFRHPWSNRILDLLVLANNNKR